MSTTVEILKPAGFRTLTNPGVASIQMLSPHNAPEARVTITKVTMQPGAAQARHAHPASEQTWIVERGVATLLLADGGSRSIGAGDVVRTPAGETHGIVNSGTEPFVYLAVTTPPVDFTPAYRGAR